METLYTVKGWIRRLGSSDEWVELPAKTLYRGQTSIDRIIFGCREIASTNKELINRRADSIRSTILLDQSLIDWAIVVEAAPVHASRPSIAEAPFNGAHND